MRKQTDNKKMKTKQVKVRLAFSSSVRGSNPFAVTYHNAKLEDSVFDLLMFLKFIISEDYFCQGKIKIHDSRHLTFFKVGFAVLDVRVISD